MSNGYSDPYMKEDYDSVSQSVTDFSTSAKISTGVFTAGMVVLASLKLAADQGYVPDFNGTSNNTLEELLVVPLVIGGIATFSSIISFLVFGGAYLHFKSAKADLERRYPDLKI